MRVEGAEPRVICVCIFGGEISQLIDESIIYLKYETLKHTLKKECELTPLPTRRENMNK
jgi:hypothetical protein